SSKAAESLVQSPAARARQRFFASYASWVGMGLVGVFVFIALGADFLSPYPLGHLARQTDEVNGQATLLQSQPASGDYWFGTDAHAKDLLTRVMYGSRLSLL